MVKVRAASDGPSPARVGSHALPQAGEGISVTTSGGAFPLLCILSTRATCHARRPVPARAGEAPPGELCEPWAGLMALLAAGFNPWNRGMPHSVRPVSHGPKATPRPVPDRDDAPVPCGLVSC